MLLTSAIVIVICFLAFSIPCMHVRLEHICVSHTTSTSPTCSLSLS
jgi:hypothetical protein